ncbi:MAG: PQQ-dependent sugar dehydrogenase [Verrucomicrobiota bacterium JB023]|nr:PQQ-dependent sugar dehydrogenase [Verrucomicrobiota bacterium JB023]
MNLYFSKKIFGLVLLASTFLSASEEIPPDEHFRVDTLVEGLVDAMEITVLPTGDVFIVERTGGLKWYSPKTEETKLVKTFDVSVRRKGISRETGLLGITHDPDFMRNGWIYCYYSPKKEEAHFLSRFTFKAGELRDEKILLKVPQSRKEGVCHEGGSLAFDGQGHLFLSTGDNTCPFKSNGSAPIDERKGNEHLNAQRSAANTNDLRGKILRIRPTQAGSYEIPAGNLFPKGKPNTRPEIYAMGCRNPWRIGVNRETGTVYWGDVGPDARKDTSRGPRGYCEINQAKTAGNYGWPYFVADKAYAYHDFEAGKTGDRFDPKNPANKSRLNTGLTDLPPARSPFWYEPRSCYCAGPVFHYSSEAHQEGGLPAELDQCLISYDWNTGRMQLSKLDDNEELVWKKDWLTSKNFVHPSDVEIGTDGVMYVLEYSSVWYDGSDGKLKRVTYTPGSTNLAEDEGPDPRLQGLDADHPGTKLLGEATCLSCHQTQVTSIGPRYADVADRYRDQEGAQDLLAQRIIAGSVGQWGEVPMPPHPQYSEEQVSQMVDAILSLEPGGHKE